MSRVAQVKSETMPVFKMANQTQAFHFKQIVLLLKILWTSSITLKLITSRKAIFREKPAFATF